MVHLQHLDQEVPDLSEALVRQINRILDDSFDELPEVDAAHRAVDDVSDHVLELPLEHTALRSLRNHLEKSVVRAVKVRDEQDPII